MRGKASKQRAMFYSIDLDQLVPANHPLRAIKRQVDEELAAMRPHFNKAYSSVGRPSVPPEMLIKATLLQALFSIRSERQLCEQIAYNMMYRWFLDLPPDADVWVPSTFAKNRERFAEHGLMQRFFDSSVARAIATGHASDEHFSVDGTVIEAWASMKSFQPKADASSDDDRPASGAGGGAAGGDTARGDANRWASFSGQRRSNDTHASTTDPDARLYRKSHGQEAVLGHSLHVLSENRHGLLLDVAIAEANGRIEREQALVMLDRVRRRHRCSPATLGADKGYDAGPFLHELESRDITPHVAIRDGRIAPPSAASPHSECRRRARRRSSQVGYAKSQVRRRLAEPIVGWLKEIAGLARTAFVGHWKTALYAYAAGAAYNFMRLANLAVVR